LVFNQDNFICQNIFDIDGDTMHIMEGFLPHPWWEIWFALSLPVVAYGVYRMNNIVKDSRETLPLLAVAGAFVFVLSSLKLPSITGSCSHPTGTGMGAIIFGPWITSVMATIVLVYQAVFLAHGGLTTLGANTFSMGIAGPIVGYLVYRTAIKTGLNLYLAVFLAAMIADWATYLVTSIQLALAFPASSGGVLASFQAFAAVFAITQVPLAIVEGVVTALMFKYIVQLRSDVLEKLKVVPSSMIARLKEASA
jgi:cobalt/nickel transport system permease protein